VARGEKAPRQRAAAIFISVRDARAPSITVYSTRACVPAVTLRPDATVECEECGLPMFPFAETETRVTLECANQHQLSVALPADKAMRALIDNWIAKKGAQLHAQHERWEREEDD
jgi:hypothetical protein